MRIGLHALALLLLSLSLLVAFLISLGHFLPIFIHFALFLLILFAFPVLPIHFVLFFCCRLGVIFVLLICLRVLIGSILFPSWQFLAFLGLEVKAKDYQQLKHVEYYQNHVDEHVTIIESTESAP